MSSNLTQSYLYSSVELIWVYLSPLIVLWDVAYVLLRPLSMPGGSIHNPLWIPYKLYGEVDHLYGLPGLEKGNGLVSAFAIINFLESSLYIWCAWKIYRESKISQHREGRWLQERCIEGCVGNQVLLVMFSSSLTVCTKTVLYGKSVYLAMTWRFSANQVQLSTRYFRTLQILATTTG